MLALALAIAVHEIAIGAAGFLRIEREGAEHPAAVTQVVLEMRPPPISSPQPTPTARPVPPPLTPPPKATPSTRREVAAPKTTVVARTQHSGGSQGGQRLEVHDPKIVHHKESLPIWWSAPHGSQVAANTGTGTTPTAGPAAGSGQGSGTGSGAGDASGNGGGTGGNGSGAVNADTPCGYPVFYGRSRYNRDGSVDATVRVELTLENGQTVSGEFHYPLHYPSEAQNPFSPHWTGGPAIPAQLPPPGYDLSAEPPAVQLTLKYTLPNGFTRFARCPT